MSQFPWNTFLAAAGMAMTGMAATAHASRGDGFVLSFSPPQGQAEQQVHRLLTRLGEVTQIIDALNGDLRLPAAVSVQFGSAEGPQYDPETHTIEIPYAYVADTFDALKAANRGMSQGDLETMTMNDLEWTLYHEVGHALVDILKLPVLGREEDAVDGLATLFAIDGWEEGADIALAAADIFAIDHEASADEPAYWDEHGLDAQRYYQILCWTYGSDPARFSNLVGDDALPAERAEGCPAEYEQMSNSWYTLLAPALRQETPQAARTQEPAPAVDPGQGRRTAPTGDPTMGQWGEPSSTGNRTREQGAGPAGGGRGGEQAPGPAAAGGRGREQGGSHFKWILDALRAQPVAPKRQ